MQTTHLRKKSEGQIKICKEVEMSPKRFWANNETKMNFDQNDGKAKIWRKKSSPNDPKKTQAHQWSMVEEVMSRLILERAQ